MVKLEAAGNDFLVLFEETGGQPVSLDAAEVRAVCDRRRGVGADGLIVARVVTDGRCSRPAGDHGPVPGTGPGSRSGSDPGPDRGSNPGPDRGSNPGSDPGSDTDGGPGPRPGTGTDTGSGAGTDTGAVRSVPLPVHPGPDLEMVLYNADGSEAEMSGNGIRCLVHAAVGAGAVEPGDVCVETKAGLRTVSCEPETNGAAWARVHMGAVRLGHEVPSPIAGTRARLADVGNPHLVAIGDVDLDSVDLESLRADAEQSAGGPVNLEVVRPGRAGADLDLRVLERGVGETLACGTGTCAAAAVARSFGMVGDTVTVDNPGGRLEVQLGAARRTTAPAASSTGPVTPPVTSPAGAAAAFVPAPVPEPDAHVDDEVDPVVLGGPVRKVADVRVDASFLRAAGEVG